jgi:CRISPR-associated helicase Cas3/CRISPR-associated endonuclease Cas3-HD
MRRFFAHTASRSDGQPDPDESRWQPLAAHLRNVAGLARRFAEPLGLADEAELAGWLHDLGKYAERFQDRLHDPRIHGINHWSVGSAEAFARRALAAAFAIEGHHTGMPALKENDAESGLEGLLERLRNLRDPNRAREVNGFTESLADLLTRHASENQALPAALIRGTSEASFAAALRTRLLFSCLVDADFLDTERHFDPAQAALRQPPVLDAIRALEILLADLRKRTNDTALNQLRRRLLDDCLTAATKPPGLFSLTAPTGSGKTLASLAFALAHAQAHGHRRIIVVIPFTSIIEQTARVYRDLFEPAFGPEFVLEHHSAVAPRERKEDVKQDAEEERLRRARLATENWDAPLVVTTSVQFFESLFGHKPSQCRKLHNIARSVVLFDEVQTLPLKLVPSLLSAVNLLVKDYGVTAVFGTATQPAFTTAAAAIEGGWSPVEISSQPRAMAEALKRTRITLPARDHAVAWPELADQLAAYDRVLCVVNLKRHARDLFQALAVRPSAGGNSPSEFPPGLFHLSASMCPAHRQEKLAEIRRRLQDGEPCRLISTQLIEAGVDVDFPRVFRALGPLDSIVQTAGRCNREGRLNSLGEVTVFRPADEGRLPLGYDQARAVTEAFLTENPGADLHDPATYAAYFARLYGTLGPQAADYDPAFKASAALHFPAAARACRLVGDETRAVLVRWGDGERLVAQMRREKHLSRDDWRLAHRFSVNFYQAEFGACLARGEIIQPVPDVDFYFWNGHYDEHLGVTTPTLNDYNL